MSYYQTFTASGAQKTNPTDTILEVAYKGFTGITIYEGSDNTGAVIVAGGAGPETIEVTGSPAFPNGLYVEVAGTGSGSITLSGASAPVVVTPPPVVTPPAVTAPSVPTAVKGSTSGTSATIAFAAPTNAGGSPITGYTITRDGTGSDGQVGWTATQAAAGSYVFNNLVAGSTYNLTVAATNAKGTGPAASVKVTVPAATTTTPPPVTTGGSDVTSFTTPAPVGPAGTFSLEFSDDFVGTTLDATKWVAERPDGPNGGVGWGGGEWYDHSAVSVANSNAVLTMTAQASGGRPYKSGVISTGKEGSPLYYLTPGRYIEARIKVPPASDGALWPSFWGFGPSWPPEIDFFEFGYTGDGGMGNTHGLPNITWHPSSTSQTSPGTYGTGDARGAYHTYGLLWTAAGVVTPYFDGVAYPKQSISGITAKQQFIIFSHQSEIASGVNVPSQYLVDWIRVWKSA